MKKQILFLTFFVAAILAGNNAFGQYENTISALDSCLTPTPLNCAGGLTLDELHPQPGETYTYRVNTSDAGATPDEIHWYVINNNDLSGDSIIKSFADMDHIAALIDADDGAGTYILDAEDVIYNNPLGTPTGDAVVMIQDSIDISWKSFDGSTEVILLVALVQDASGCTDNIEVWRIVPQFNFTLDIAAINTVNNSYYVDTATVRPEECVSPIESAVYAPSGATPPVPGDGTLTVDYGENWVYFIVNAANFVDSWEPTFNFAYTGTGGIGVLTADWTYPNAVTTAGTWNSINVGSGATNVVVAGGGHGNADGTSLNAAGTGFSAGLIGECIVVRVRVDHGNAENVDERMLTVTVDGIMFDNSLVGGATTYYDDNTSFGDLNVTSCAPVSGDDLSNYYITPRPDINPNHPSPFEGKDGRDN